MSALSRRVLPVVTLLLTLLSAPSGAHAATLEDLLSQAEPYADVVDIVSIINLDVVAYYQLSDQYNTDLKKEMYKRSQDYKDKLAELTVTKNATLGKLLYIKLEDSFEEFPYNLQRKAFLFRIGTNFGFGTVDARAPKEINGVRFSLLPTEIEPSVLGSGTTNELIMIPMLEEPALDVENNSANTFVYLFFKLSAKPEPVSFRFLNAADGAWYQMKGDRLSARYTRLVIANDNTGDVYLNRELKAK